MKTPDDTTSSEEMSISTLKWRIKKYGLRRKQDEYDIVQVQRKTIIMVSIMVMVVYMVIDQYGTPYG